VSEPAKPFFFQALDVLKAGDRRTAAALLARQLAEGNTSPNNLRAVAQLAAQIGEVGLAMDAARQAVVPGNLETLIAYWGMLGTYGRSQDAADDIARQSEAVRQLPAVLHIQGNLATQTGRLDEARDFFRTALARAPGAMETWFSLAMIKRFAPGDPDLSAMERLVGIAGSPALAQATLHHALGKAAEDCGDVDRAFGFYAKAAELTRRERSGPDVNQFAAAADRVISDFTTANLGKLSPSSAVSRSLFVTGMPRSGTTLVEQIMLGHSAVTDGAEVNVFGAAMMPVRGVGWAQALTLQQRSGSETNPWTEIGEDYARLIDVRFPLPGRVVDKSLGQSLTVGLMLHALPEARIAWLKRSPDDVALSCFRTFFSTGLPWTTSLSDIAVYMRAEDRLLAHWRTVFPDRILVVPYEELAASPGPWAQRLQEHFGLQAEQDIERRAPSGRAIATASVSQVREPISTARIGQAAKFERHLKPFRESYYN